MVVLVYRVKRLIVGQQKRVRLSYITQGCIVQRIERQSSELDAGGLNPSTPSKILNMVGYMYNVKMMSSKGEVFFNETFPFVNKPSEEDLVSFLKLIRPVEYQYGPPKNKNIAYCASVIAELIIPVIEYNYL